MNDTLVIGLETTKNAFEKVAPHFDLANYSVFLLMLAMSSAIGIYFGCFGTKQKTRSEYILGEKTMKVFPIAVSMVAGGISATTLISVPGEIYTEGPSYWLIVVALFFGCIIYSYIFVPVYCGIEMVSAYEYLEHRFSKGVRRFTSVLYVFHCILFLPVLIYIPALSLSQVTGINLHYISAGASAVCIFYTMIGGLKAVVWTDFVQAAITVVACITIVTVGTIDAGGFTHVWKTAREGGKLSFNYDPNPFQKNTFWTALIGFFVTWTAGLASAQSTIQRMMAVPTVQDARKVIVLYWIGMAFMTTLSVYGGILMFSVYHGCDPIKQKLVSKQDQMYPYYVLDKVGYIPLLPGLFEAGVFSAALSSLSGILNTLAGTIYEDYVKRKGITEERANLIMKSTVLIIGTCAVLMVYAVEHMGAVIPILYQLGGVTGAPCAALFIMGILIPPVNTKGAITGAICSIVVLVWVTAGSMLNQVNSSHKEVYPGVVSTCEVDEHTTAMPFTPSNFTQTTSSNQQGDEVFFMFRLSYMYYKTLGIAVALIVGVIVSYLTGPQDLTTLDPKLITPPLRRFLPKPAQKAENQEVELKLMNKLKEINNA